MFAHARAHPGDRAGLMFARARAHPGGHAGSITAPAGFHPGAHVESSSLTRGIHPRGLLVDEQLSGCQVARVRLKSRVHAYPTLGA